MIGKAANNSAESGCCIVFSLKHFRFIKNLFECQHYVRNFFLYKLLTFFCEYSQSKTNISIQLIVSNHNQINHDLKYLIDVFRNETRAFFKQNCVTSDTLDDVVYVPFNTKISAKFLYKLYCLCLMEDE